MKPNEVVNTLTYCSNDFGSHHLLISLAAGICLNKIENVSDPTFLPPIIKWSFLQISELSNFKILKNNVRVVRIMTNLAALVQQGCSVYAKGTYVNAGKFSQKMASLTNRHGNY